MTEPGALPNDFEQDKPGTPARDRSESRIEGVRALGGVFVEAVRATRLPMVLTDPALPGDPIVFANQSFLDLSGYSLEEALGQQPHFMNGPDTDPADAARFAQILARNREGVVDTVQYGKDGEPFVAKVLLSAFHDESGKTIHHFLTWADVTPRADAVAEARRLRIERDLHERHGFLLELSDALRPLTRAEDQRAASCRLLGERLNADRVYYVTFDAAKNVGSVQGDFSRPGLASLTGVYPYESFRRTYDRIFEGATWVVADAHAEEVSSPEERAAFDDLGIRAWINTPSLKDGTLEATLCVVSSEPREWSELEIDLTEETAQRLWESVGRTRAEASLRESEERLRLIVENAQDYAIFTTDPAGTIIDWREGAEAVFGYSRGEIVGQDCDILFTPEDRADNQPEKERAIAAEHGKAPDVRWHMRKDGTRVFIDGVSTALRSPEGKLIGFLKIGQDTTERHAADERQKLLLAELQHRVRNTLGMIRSMVRFTAEGHDDLDDYLSHLTGRLDSLSRTQQLLTRHSNARVDLHELVSEEMTAQAGGRSSYHLDGPSVLLAPKAAEVLSLALHELVTNSVKYGALGDVRGQGTQVDVRWHVAQRDGQDWLELGWRERASELAPSERRGFGTELITQRVPYELGGEASLDIGEHEVAARIAFPLVSGPSSLLETGAPRPAVR